MAGMNLRTFFSLIGVPAMLSCSFAAVPEHFSDRAKELLADSIELEAPAHKVNVIYFVGNDIQPVADYRRRLSELLLYLQQFYGKEMARNGYGNRAFGLPMLPNGEVDITLLRAAGPHTDYPYSGGGALKCMEELDAYFKEHPDRKHSEHSFIIMPTWQDDKNNDKNPGGVPFFGYGKNCFALDYTDFDIRHLGHATPEGKLLTKWYGGFAHELGHGLNLPHNNGTASQNAALGTALMNCGNYTFGTSPTYLTPSTCSILDRSETFATADNKTEFYQNHTAPVIRDLCIEYDGNHLKVELQCTADVVINAYVQDPPYAVNQDYDAVAFRVEPQGEPQDGMQHMVVSIPLSELTSLQNTGKAEQGLDLLFGFKDGSRFRTRITLPWEGVKPGDRFPVGEIEFHEGY